MPGGNPNQPTSAGSVHADRAGAGRAEGGVLGERMPRVGSMSTEGGGTRRLTGCLPRREALRQWNELAQTFTALRLPERVACRKWGRGWALFAVPIDEEEGTALSA